MLTTLFDYQQYHQKTKNKKNHQKNLFHSQIKIKKIESDPKNKNNNIDQQDIKQESQKYQTKITHQKKQHKKSNNTNDFE